jgi:CheY-like chemotaxis protein
MAKGSILIVDDDDDCVKLMTLAMIRLGAGDRVAVARDGEEAMSYLKGEGKFADREEFPFPLLILLDLKMPRVDGFGLLRWIRHESPFWYLPVVVLTVSDLDKDVWKAYAAGANSYMVKAVGLDDLALQVKSVIDHWVRFSMTPGPLDVPAPPPKAPV